MTQFQQTVYLGYAIRSLVSEKSFWYSTVYSFFFCNPETNGEFLMELLEMEIKDIHGIG